jgi:hypothetical protein
MYFSPLSWLDAKITGQLAKTLCSTNPCESMIEIVRYTQRNVKRWHDGDMRKRWTAAGMLQAEQQFRRIIGYRDLAKLIIAIERHATLIATKNLDRQEIAEPVTGRREVSFGKPGLGGGGVFLGVERAVGAAVV